MKKIYFLAMALLCALSRVANAMEADLKIKKRNRPGSVTMSKETDLGQAGTDRKKSQMSCCEACCEGLLIGFCIRENRQLACHIAREHLRERHRQERIIEFERYLEEVAEEKHAHGE